MLGKSFTLGDISQRCKAKTSLFPGREDVGESKTDASSCVPFDHAENTHPPANDTLTACVFPNRQTSNTQSGGNKKNTLRRLL